jgi:hypothetical protein
MSPDEWQAHVTREAAKEIGKWLEARGRLAHGRLDHSIASLKLPDLEAMASVTISRFIVLASARSADVNPGALGFVCACSGRSSLPTNSARASVRTSARTLQQGITE